MVFLVDVGVLLLVRHIRGEKGSLSAYSHTINPDKHNLFGYSYDNPMLYVPNPVPEDQVSKEATIGTMEDWLNNFYVNFPSFEERKGTCRGEALPDPENHVHD